MLEIILCIVLLPAAVVSAIFTVALGVGLVKAFGKKDTKKN